MINSLLDKFLREKVNPDPDVIKQASESQQRLREILANKLSEDPNLPSVLDGQDFLFGSAIRGTQIKPFDDIDLMLVLDGSTLVATEAGQNMGPAHGTGKMSNPLLLPQYLDEKGQVSSQKVLARIREVLAETYSRSDIRKDGQAINVWMDTYGFGIDVVPAFKIDHIRHGTHYFIPLGTGSAMWQSTNPLSDLNAFKSEDTRLNGLLGLTARIMRKWNELSNGGRLSGFHVDALVYRSLQDKNIQTLKDAVRACFESFSTLLANASPQFSGFTPHIDHKLSEEHRTQSKEALQTAHGELLGTGLAGLLVPKDRDSNIWNKIFNYKLIN
jgi:hypothetical protein